MEQETTSSDLKWDAFQVSNPELFEWVVVCRPVAVVRKKKNESGLSILLRKGNLVREVARVAFARANAPNPEVSFVDALQDALDRAEEAVATLNEMDREFDKIRVEAVKAAQVRIDELFGNTGVRLV